MPEAWTLRPEAVITTHTFHCGHQSTSWILVCIVKLHGFVGFWSRTFHPLPSICTNFSFFFTFAVVNLHFSRSSSLVCVQINLFRGSSKCICDILRTWNDFQSNDPVSYCVSYKVVCRFDPLRSFCIVVGCHGCIYIITIAQSDGR